jgi:hypothetical protein
VITTFIVELKKVDLSKKNTGFPQAPARGPRGPRPFRRQEPDVEPERRDAVGDAGDLPGGMNARVSPLGPQSLGRQPADRNPLVARPGEQRPLIQMVQSRRVGALSRESKLTTPSINEGIDASYPHRPSASRTKNEQM